MITKIGYNFFAFDLEHRFLMKFLVSIKIPLKWVVTWHVFLFAYAAYFRRNSDKLTIFQTGKPNFSGPSNNGLSCSEVKPSILKSAYSATLILYAISFRERILSMQQRGLEGFSNFSKQKLHPGGNQVKHFMAQ